MTINSVTSMNTDINAMLAKIRDVNGKNKAFATQGAGNLGHSQKTTGSFSDVMGSISGVLDKVNTLQSTTESVKNSYLLGDNKTSMADVIVSTQKSKLAFEGLVTVRNKILDAYKEIMNMPI